MIKQKTIAALKILDPRNGSVGLQHDRLRRIIWTVGTSAGGRFLSILVPFITTPITQKYLGNEIFGCWMTIVGFMAMLVFADFGIGNGLLTELSRCHGEKNYAEARRLLAAGYTVLGAVAVGGIVLTLSLHNAVPWGRLVNATDSATEAAAEAIATVSLLCFFLSLPLGLIRKVQLSVQRGFVCDIWDSCAALCSLTALVFAIYMRMSVAVLVFCVTGVPLIFNFLNTVFFFYRTSELRWWRALHVLDTKNLKVILSTGGQFFVLSIFTSLALYCDNLIVAHLFSLDEVANFSITSKPAKMLLLIGTVICIPLWPANGEAMVRKEYDWVRKNTWRMSLFSAVATFFCAVLLLSFGKLFFRLWMGRAFDLNMGLLCALTLWPVILSFISPYFMVLNSCGMIKTQIVMWMFFLPLSVVLKLFCGIYGGVSWIIWSMNIGYLVFVVPWTILACRRCWSKHFNYGLKNDYSK